NIVSHPIPEYLLKRLQRVQLAAVGFVLWRYAHMPDIHNLTRTLRSSKETTLKVSLESDTFQDSASNVFNSLPSAVKFLVI
ncbi:unnamed protein product, partial [Porites evermanni]